MAWIGKILRVNLTEGSCTPEPLNMTWAHHYLGQRGLATKYLAEETDPKVDPLSPDNKMIMSRPAFFISLPKKPPEFEQAIAPVSAPLVTTE